MPSSADSRAHPEARVARVALLALGLALFGAPGCSRDDGVMHVALPLEPGQRVAHESEAIAISPDGSRVAYAATDSGGGRTLWVRDLSAKSPRRIPGTTRLSDFTWSPGGRWLAFTESGDASRLVRIPADGGDPVPLCEIDAAHGVSWGKRDILVFAPSATGPLLQVPGEGGEPTPATVLDPTIGETGHRQPVFLPDGNHFLYVSSPAGPSGFAIYAGSLTAREQRKKIMVAASAPVYVEPGFLLYRSGGQIMAQKFDAGRLELIGTPAAIAEAPALSDEDAAPVATASRNGTLAYLSYRTPQRRIEWLDRSGQPRGRPAIAAGFYAHPALAPDGRRLLVGVAAPGQAPVVEVIDLERDSTVRVSPRGVTGFGRAAWSPDGKKIALALASGGVQEIWRAQPVFGDSLEKVATTPDATKSATGFTSDGDTLLVTSGARLTGLDLWLVPLDGTGRARPWRRTTDREAHARLSPDGHWIAYESDETGRSEIYVESFPVPGRRALVSKDGGTSALWTKAGAEILYEGPGGSIVAAAFAVSSVGMPTVQPGVALCRPDGLREFTATPDGERILAIVADERAMPPTIRLTFHWPALLPGR